MTEDKVWFTPDNIFTKFETREEAQAHADKLNAILQVKQPAYVRKWWTTADVGDQFGFTEEEKQEIADYVNEHGYRDPYEPTPVLVRFFGTKHKGYYYFPDENHSGHCYVTEEGARKYKVTFDERLDEIWDQAELDDINEDQPEDNPWVYDVYIEQYWSVYDSNGIEVPESEWKNLPIDCQPYEEEFVLAINGIPPALIEDEENCFVAGWCDG